MSEKSLMDFRAYALAISYWLCHRPGCSLSKRGHCNADPSSPDCDCGLNHAYVNLRQVKNSIDVAIAAEQKVAELTAQIAELRAQLKGEQ